MSLDIACEDSRPSVQGIGTINEDRRELWKLPEITVLVQHDQVMARYSPGENPHELLLKINRGEM